MLKKNFVAAAAAIGLAGMAVVPATPALAQSDNAATIDKDFGCVLIDWPGPALFTSSESVSVVTSSDVTTLVCHFDVPEGAEPAKAYVGAGFNCGTFLGLTNDSKAVVTPGGRATLICKINGASDT